VNSDFEPAGRWQFRHSA